MNNELERIWKDVSTLHIIGLCKCIVQYCTMTINFMFYMEVFNEIEWLVDCFMMQTQLLR
jgi:hypothetical protein